MGEAYLGIALGSTLSPNHTFTIPVLTAGPAATDAEVLKHNK